MDNSPLIRPYFLGGVALGGVARIPMKMEQKMDPGPTRTEEIDCSRYTSIKRYVNLREFKVYPPKNGI